MKYLILVILSLCPLLEANAEAYCSLRDPVAQIKALYPQKTKQLSIVKTVDEMVRKQVKKALPSNDLHFSELGRHTLYVAMNQTRALGYVHVRSEQSKWGLVEIAWALDKDLKIKNFMCQRCRSPNRHEIEKDSFKNLFIGKNFQQLKILLNSDGVTANETVLSQSKQAPELASVVLRSALKTLLITDVLWGQELTKFNKK